MTVHSNLIILYHGTTAENAEQIKRTGCFKDNTFWAANDPNIAAGYGACVLAVKIPRDAKIDVYPLSSGKLEQVLFLLDEPCEFEIFVNGPVEIITERL